MAAIALRVVVGVLVALPVLQILHQLRGRVAQMERHWRGRSVLRRHARRGCTPLYTALLFGAVAR